MFDDVFLLTKGRIVYYGEGKETMVNYFSSIDYKCPASSNPADFVLDIASIDLRSVQLFFAFSLRALTKKEQGSQAGGSVQRAGGHSR